MRRVSMALLLAAALVAGCGGGGAKKGQADATTAATTPAVPTTPAPAPAPAPRLQLPPGVPSGPASPVRAVREEELQVIRRWSRLLRGGDARAAARTFAPGTRVQNGGPILELTSVGDRIGFNAALTCGSRPTRLRGADNGYVIVDFVLVERPGGACGQGVGANARCAIRVRDGRITDWIRLLVPDDTAPQEGTEV